MTKIGRLTNHVNHRKPPQTTKNHYHHTKPNPPSPIFQQNQPRSTMTQQNINCPYHHRMINFQALFHSQRSTGEEVPIQGNPRSHTKRDLCGLTNHINPGNPPKIKPISTQSNPTPNINRFHTLPANPWFDLGNPKPTWLARTSSSHWSNNNKDAEPSNNNKATPCYNLRPSAALLWYVA